MASQLSLLDHIASRPSLPNVHFSGATYDPSLDLERLNAQQRRVHDAMIDGAWRTLREIGAITDDPEASISARLRDFNNHEYLSQFFVMDSERLPGLERRGVWRYRVRMRGP
jgi:hypothetical protein